MTFSPKAIEAAEEAACQCDNMFREVFDRHDRADIIRAALSAALAVDGLALVPRVPSEAMLEAGEQTFTSGYSGTPISTPADVWSAMLAAASDEPAPALQGWRPIDSAHPCDPSHPMSFSQPPAASDREERK